MMPYTNRNVQGILKGHQLSFAPYLLTYKSVYSCGKRTVYVTRKDPNKFIMKKDGGREYVDIVKKMYEQKANAGELVFNLERGTFDLIAVLDESVSQEPYTIKGLFIDLFDLELPVLTEKTVNLGEQSYLFDINRVGDKSKPQVLAAASHTDNEKRGKDSYSFTTKSPLNRTNIMRVLLPSAPKSTAITDAAGNGIKGASCKWDENSKTCLLGFENNPDGVNVSLKW